MRKYENPFWYRVGSAFENGYGSEGPLATFTARLIPLLIGTLFYAIPAGIVALIIWAFSFLV